MAKLKLFSVMLLQQSLLVLLSSTGVWARVDFKAFDPENLELARRKICQQVLDDQLRVAMHTLQKLEKMCPGHFWFDYKTFRLYPAKENKMESKTLIFQSGYNYITRLEYDSITYYVERIINVGDKVSSHYRVANKWGEESALI